MHTLTEFSALRIHPYFLSFKRPSPHSKFSPSSADRWLVTGCSFSIEFVQSKQIVDEESDYSKGGTIAHSVCEAVFRQTFYGINIPAKLMMEVMQWDAYQEKEGKSGAAQEMFDAARDYVEIISFWLNNESVIGKVIHFGLEMGIPVFPDKSCFGTGDCIIIGTRASVVIDFKFGIGHVVKADSPQLKVYAAGLSRWLDQVPADYKIHTVIFQPRVSNATKEWTYTMPELYAFLGVIWESILFSERKDLTPVEGKHCWWCPAKRTRDENKKCPTILNKPLLLAQENFAAYLQDMSAPVVALNAPNHKRDAAILKIHALYPMIKHIVEATTDEILFKLERNIAVPGFYLKEVEGNRQINGTTDEERAALIKSKYLIDPWREIPAKKTIRTLSDMEKELGKNTLNVVCHKKITKKLDIHDDRMVAALGELASYAQMINNGEGQED